MTNKIVLGCICTVAVALVASSAMAADVSYTATNGDSSIARPDMAADQPITNSGSCSTCPKKEATKCSACTFWKTCDTCKAAKAAPVRFESTNGNCQTCPPKVCYKYVDQCVPKCVKRKVVSYVNETKMEKKLVWVTTAVPPKAHCDCMGNTYYTDCNRTKSELVWQCVPKCYQKKVVSYVDETIMEHQRVKVAVVQPMVEKTITYQRTICVPADSVNSTSSNGN